MANAVQTGWNMLQVAAVRLPFLCASASGALMVAELAIRALRGTVGKVGNFDNITAVKYVYDRTPAWVGRTLRPYRDQKDFPNTTLAAYAFAACAIGTFGSDLVSYALGPVPPIYNRALMYLGPVRISPNYHPATEWAMNRLGF